MYCILIKIVKAEEKDPNAVKLDKSGYFVIVPKPDINIILVEHYNYTNQLLRIIEVKTQEIFIGLL